MSCWGHQAGVTGAGTWYSSSSQRADVTNTGNAYPAARTRKRAIRRVAAFLSASLGERDQQDRIGDGHADSHDDSHEGLDILKSTPQAILDFPPGHTHLP